jgi:hypothetical protein
MMTKELAKKLGVSGEKSNLYLSWTDSRVKVEKESENVVIEISGIGRYDKKFKLKNVKTVSESNLDLPLPIRDVKDLQAKCGHLKGIQIPEPFNMKPAILIGLEHSKLGVAKQVRQGKWGKPIASKTPLGWVVHGKHRGSRNDNKDAHRLCVVTEVFANDDLERSSDQNTPRLEHNQDENARKLFQEKQLKNVLELDKNGGLFFEGSLKEVIVEELPAEEADTFPVKNPHKPNENRGFNVAEDCCNMSLNIDHIADLNLLELVIGDPWRFRYGNIGLGVRKSFELAMSGH